MLDKILLYLISFLFLVSPSAYAVTLKVLNNKSQAPSIPATSYLIMNPASKTILHGRAMHKKLPPASLTKLMTLLLVYDCLAAKTCSLHDKVRISQQAWSQPGSRMFLEKGSKVHLADIINGIAVVSGNDASVAAAEYVAGSEKDFTKLMNKKAKELGMHNSKFMNASGLPRANHYTTAYDLALLASTLYKSYPEIMPILKKKKFSFNKISQKNRNRLLWLDPYVTGMKTGHTNTAGFCLVASAWRNNTPLIAVALGSKSEKQRDNAGKVLLHYGDHYFKHTQVAHDTKLPSIRVRYGKQKQLQPQLAYGVSYSIARHQNDFRVKIVQEKEINAPVYIGYPVGHYDIYQGEQLISSVPILAQEKIEQAGMFAQLYDWLELKYTEVVTMLYNKLTSLRAH